jgi:hypothetical protein
MISEYKYTFIIGAGGSDPYEFPLGLSLYEKIAHNCQNYVKDAFNKLGMITGYNSGWIDTAQHFSKELQKTNNISIDKYLNINQSFLSIGIHSIAAEIYNSEKHSNLPFFSNSIKGDWYSYLYQKMIEGLDTKKDLLRIHENKISFITFNYDRSLEHYLFETYWGLLKNAGVNWFEAAKAFAKIPIYHVYGKIGNLPYQLDEEPDLNKIYDSNWIKYGHKNVEPFEASMKIHKMINLIYEDRIKDIDIEIARKMIGDSDKVLFLGFGYDKRNLKLLGVPELLAGKQVFGTAKGMTSNEIRQINSLLGITRAVGPSKILDTDCLSLLRDFLN